MFAEQEMALLEGLDAESAARMKTTQHKLRQKATHAAIEALKAQALAEQIPIPHS